jgi:hypothetical protein
MTRPISKQGIKQLMHNSHYDRIEREMADKSTLRNLSYKRGHTDHIFNLINQDWWLKIAVGGLFLNHRKVKVEDQICPMCGEGRETFEHFAVECDKYPPTATCVTPLLASLDLKRDFL